MSLRVGVAAAALFLVPAYGDGRLPAMTPQDIAECEAGDGCLVITRAALKQMMERKSKDALFECRNYMRGEGL